MKFLEFRLEISLAKQHPRNKLSLTTEAMLRQEDQNSIQLLVSRHQNWAKLFHKMFVTSQSQMWHHHRFLKDEIQTPKLWDIVIQCVWALN